MTQNVLALIALPPQTHAALAARYALQYHPEGPDGLVLSDEARSKFTAVVTNGTTGLRGAHMAKFPGLRFICSYGAGYENIDLAQAGQLGIAVANAPNTNCDTVADHAIGLMLALCRGYAPLTQAVKRGEWNSSRSARPTLSGSTVGIIGMGRVGQAIARRAAAFDMTVCYTARTARSLVAGTFVPDVVELARRSDFLVAACPGGASTRHLVNRDVLNALGPEGYLVNVARGSVVNTSDLIFALQDGTIAGAGLDVLETEPEVPVELQVLDNVLMTPHMAGRSPAAQLKQRDALLENFAAFFEGRPLASPVRPDAAR
ncbi:MAG: 2-hydroxyacid dehydrogenase [Burkholderiales bacterium]